MSFSPSKKYKWILTNTCTKLGIKTDKGLELLFNQFIKDYNPPQIFTQCNFDKFTGKSYENLGFKFIEFTGPKINYLDVNKLTLNSDKNSKSTLKIFNTGFKKYLWFK